MQKLAQLSRNRPQQKQSAPLVNALGMSFWVGWKYVQTYEQACCDKSQCRSYTPAIKCRCLASMFISPDFHEQKK